MAELYVVAQIPVCPEPLRIFESTIVSSVIQDSTGYIYIGSRKGIFRYDGIELKPILTDENCIFQTIPPRDMKIYGDELIVVENELILIDLNDPANYSKIDLGEGNKNWRFSAVEKDKNGNLWVIFDEGILVADLHSTPSKILFEISSADVSNRYNLIKIAKDFAFFTTHDGYLERYSIPEGNDYSQMELKRVKIDDFRPLIDIKDSVIFFLKNGIVKTYDPISLQERQSLNTNPIVKGAVRNFQVQYDKIFIQQSDTFSVFNVIVKDKSQQIIPQVRTAARSESRFFTDRSGVTWLYNDKGIRKLNHDGIKFKLYFTGMNGLRMDPTSSILINDGSIYCGTLKNGLKKIDLNTNRVSRINLGGDIPGSNNYGIVSSLLLENNQIVTSGLGINILSNKDEVSQWLSPKNKEIGFADWIIWSVLKDSREVFWFGTNYGMTRWDPETGKSTLYKKDNSINSLIDNHVWALAEDKNGRILIGTWGGLSILDDKTGKFTNYSSLVKPGKESFSVKVICQLPESNSVFLGTEGKGLLKLDTIAGSVQSITTKTGLYSNTIWGILPDSRAQLWLSSGKGLSVVDPVKMEVIRNYTIEDGLPFNEFNLNAYAKDKSGNLYFGGDFGIVSFNPDDITINPFPPGAPLISKLIPVFSNKISTEKGMVETEYKNKSISKFSLNRLPDSLTVVLRTFHYKNPAQNYFQYMLEGIDSVWRKSGNGILNYAGLQSGKYILRIKAVSADGIENPAITNLLIIVRDGKKIITLELLFSSLLLCGLLFLYFKKQSNRNRISELMLKILHPIYKKTGEDVLSDDECQVIIKKIDDYFASNESYLDPDINLQKLADDLDVKRHLLSLAINKGKKCNYFDLINNYRIIKSKEMILSQNYLHLSLEGIAQKCGFNSKTTFYSAFKKKYRINPICF
jgi:ligand-binding sensor domain-containing protein/AraC-like DNA-binding protein